MSELSPTVTTSATTKRMVITSAMARWRMKLR